MASWRMFYVDAKDAIHSVDSTQQLPHERPADYAGFLCAVGYRPNGARYIMHGWDFYCYDLRHRQWWGMDLPGLIQRLELGRIYAFKQGITVESEIYKEAMQLAHMHPDFPKR